MWVRAIGIPKFARTEFAAMELARLVVDPEEVHLPSLQLKVVWVKVSCQNPNKIGGTSEVFINKKGRKITWYFLDKLQNYPPSKPDNDPDDEEDDVTDEDPESQESHGWLESGKPTPSDTSKKYGSVSSSHQRQVAMGSSESTGPLAEELEMNTQGPNDGTDDYQRLMAKSDIFKICMI